ncbi:MAG: DUF169 domain-containing protein [Candidatus Zixiibacteriota bacterium]|nr:MAG: DUF169 domain-containing protein [candidate division Zixibacteria bacterium]
MESNLKAGFLEKWNKYFPGQELPITFYYTDEAGHGEAAAVANEWRCFICDLGKVRNGRPISFSADAVGCGGGKRNLGFEYETGPDFEYFLSCGIPGKLEGIRYKKTPELVRAQYSNQPRFDAPGRNIVFKRWDLLDEADQPEVVIFFARPDILAGLYTLAGFDESAPDTVITPFAAGCGTIVRYPYQELSTDRHRAILGMLDISARVYVPPGVLSFAVTWPKFVRMLDSIEESFLITPSWDKVKSRFGR